MQRIALTATKTMASSPENKTDAPARGNAKWAQRDNAKSVNYNQLSTPQSVTELVSPGICVLNAQRPQTGALGHALRV